MLPKELTRDIKACLKSISSQIKGIVIQIISGSALLFVAFYYGRVFIDLMP